MCMDLTSQIQWTSLLHSKVKRISQCLLTRLVYWIVSLSPSVLSLIIDSGFSVIKRNSNCSEIFSPLSVFFLLLQEHETWHLRECNVLFAGRSIKGGLHWICTCVLTLASGLFPAVIVQCGSLRRELWRDTLKLNILLLPDKFHLLRNRQFKVLDEVTVVCLAFLCLLFVLSSVSLLPLYLVTQIFFCLR